ncbi:TetR/AcrR family transcriptional regulator [Paenibacillus sp. N1-5-1-14]|uniref:TetR/AcrR family transcriptional regulator n=1 Tax=Paenibacillus radicibacter TaxID=2972488 RepID=UPI0021595AB1|nr:TetR/AcrR family transcriptional regulator [Paenibacillus radicibacter]MCR8643181.1 TetR/AcrR family transcriptional regulator [Paenibacillus radicibacter]
MKEVVAKTRWQQEREDAKQQRVVLMIDAAERVFNAKGIDKATMQDVATEARMGIATVFRYFPKKDKLIIAVATRIIESQIETFDTIANGQETCYEKLEKILDFFITLIGPAHSKNTKLLEAFESYAAQSTEPLEDLDLYNDAMSRIQSSIMNIIKDGMNDGSIRANLSLDDTIATMTNSFALFAKKLSLQSSIPMLEFKIESAKQLHILKDIFLSYLRP